jgi:DNA polymerase I-like protein with 3'-5' exonuclease and polymerase domains
MLMNDLPVRELPGFLTAPNPEIYRTGKWVALDFETTNVDKGSALTQENRIVLACWRTSEGKHRSVFAGEFELQELVDDINAADFLIAHNAKFELQWLQRCGLDLHNVVVYDTLLAEYVIGGNRWQIQKLSLDVIANRRWKRGKASVVAKMIKAGICPSIIPQSWLKGYCEVDVALTVELFTEQLKDMQGTRLLPVVYARCLLTPVLADIERNGMQLDEERVREEHDKTTQKFNGENARLMECAGGINLNSPKQMGVYLYDTLGLKELTKYGKPVRTAGGGRLTDAPTLMQLKTTNAKQRRFLSVYKATKLFSHDLGFYLNKFLDCCKSADNGVLYAAFNQSNTRTHRLSSTGRRYKVQLHNLPRPYKRLFRAKRKGWLVGEADEAQLEFRAAVHLGRDAQGVQDIADKIDVHNATSTIIEVGRQEAKKHTFKPLYGGQSGTKKEKEYYEYFRKRYAGITDAQNEWINGVLATGMLETEYGLRFYWPGTTMGASGYISNTTSICNYPVQGFATGEIVPLALIWMWHRIHAEGRLMYLINSIHDSIIAELPEGELDDFHRLAKQCLVLDVYYSMEAIYGVRLTVPLGCGITTGEHWGAKNEVKYELNLKSFEIETVQ